jgi:cytidine deaminase
LAYGQNTLGSNGSSIHAEADALSRNKLPKNMNLLVVRFSKNGKLGESRPCAHCIEMMKKVCESKRCSIKKVFYSTHFGTIVKENFSSLVKNGGYISSGNKSKKYRHNL